MDKVNKRKYWTDTVALLTEKMIRIEPDATKHVNSQKSGDNAGREIGRRS